MNESNQTAVETTAAPVSAPEPSLSERLQSLPGFAADVFPGKSETKSTEKTQADRGTPESDKSSEKSIEPDKAKSDITSNTPTSATEPKKDRSAQGRIKELTDKIKERESKIAEYESKLKSQTQTSEKSKPEERKPLVNPPDKPPYDRVTLTRLHDHYEDQGDVGMVRTIRDELRKVEQYERDIALWELKEGKAWEQHEAAKSYFKGEAVKNWPDLANLDSEMSKEYEKCRTLLPKTVLESFDQVPEGSFLLASLANLRIAAKGHVSKVGALEQENKTLREKLATYEKKMQPAKQSETTSAGSAVDSDDPRDFLRKGLRDIAPQLSYKR